MTGDLPAISCDALLDLFWPSIPLAVSVQVMRQSCVSVLCPHDPTPCRWSFVPYLRHPRYTFPLSWFSKCLIIRVIFFEVGR